MKTFYIGQINIDCYYLLFVQPSRIERKKNMEEVSSLQSRHFQHHLFDKNNTTVTTTLPVNVSSTNGEEEIQKAQKLVSCSDFEDIANKDMKDMVISGNSSKDIMKDS